MKQRSMPTGKARSRSLTAPSSPALPGVTTRRKRTTRRLAAANRSWPDTRRTACSSWSRTPKRTPRPVAGNTRSSTMANLFWTRRCCRAASSATPPTKITTMSSLVTRPDGRDCRPPNPRASGGDSCASYEFGNALLRWKRRGRDPTSELSTSPRLVPGQSQPGIPPMGRRQRRTTNHCRQGEAMSEEIVTERTHLTERSPAYWRATLHKILVRVLRRRCPQCGVGALFRAYARLPLSCPHCGLLYRREQGALTGTMYMTAAVGEVFAAALIFLFWYAFEWTTLEFVLVTTPLAFLFCTFFLPVAQAVWVGVEYATDLQSREPWVDWRE